MINGRWPEPNVHPAIPARNARSLETPVPDVYPVADRKQRELHTGARLQTLTLQPDFR